MASSLPVFSNSNERHSDATTNPTTHSQELTHEERTTCIQEQGRPGVQQLVAIYETKRESHLEHFTLQENPKAITRKYPCLVENRSFSVLQRKKESAREQLLRAKEKHLEAQDIYIKVQDEIIDELSRQLTTVQLRSRTPKQLATIDEGDPNRFSFMTTSSGYSSRPESMLTERYSMYSDIEDDDEYITPSDSPVATPTHNSSS